MSGIRRGLLGAALLWAALAPQVEADIAAITSQTAETLTLIDTATMKVRATVPLPGKPAAAAADGARGRFLAIAVETGKLHVFDRDGRKIATHTLPGEPFAIAIRPQSGTALVTDWRGYLHEVDPLTGGVIATWPTGAIPSGVAVEGDLIVTANRDDDTISIIDGTGVIGVVAVGHHPFGVAIGQGRIFVTNVLSDTVSVVDIATHSVVATIAVGSRPYAIAFAGGRGFVTNQYGASLSVFDQTSLQRVGEIETDEYPEGIAAFGGDKVLVANWFSDTVQVIDASRMEVVGTLAVPAGPRAFGAFIAHTGPPPTPDAVH